MPPRDEIAASGEDPTTAQATLIDGIQQFAGNDLRDTWVLDQQSQEPLYLRGDIADAIEDIDVERYLDNERFGFVTRDTYDQLHYSSFGYTLRGFDTWELFRTFLVSGDTKVEVLCSFDRRDGGFDYSKLNEDVQALTEDYPVAAFAPGAD